MSRKLYSWSILTCMCMDICTHTENNFFHVTSNAVRAHECYLKIVIGLHGSNSYTRIHMHASIVMSQLLLNVRFNTSFNSIWLICRYLTHQYQPLCLTGQGIGGTSETIWHSGCFFQLFNPSWNGTTGQG